MENMSCTSDVERSKRSFFKQNYLIYQKISYDGANILLHLFRIHAMPFYGIETWFLKLHNKYLSNVSVAYNKAIKRIYGRDFYDSNHERFEYARLRMFKHFIARKFICFAPRLFTSKNSCHMIYRQYLQCNSVFRNSLERLFNSG